MTRSHSPDWEGRRRDIKASPPGDRLDGGSECPPRERLYLLAEAVTEGASSPDGADAVRQHVERCKSCRAVYGRAVDVARRPAGVAGRVTASKGGTASGVPRWAFQVIAASVAGLVMGLLGIGYWLKGVVHARDQETIRTLQDESATKDGTIDRLQAGIKALGLANPVTLQDLAAFTVVEPGRSRLRFTGSYNPALIKEVRYRWGVEPGTDLVRLAPEDLTVSPGDGRAYFSKESGELPLKNQMAAAALEFVPDPEMARRFPEYFTPERLQYRRNFFLGRDGIEADAKVAGILEPGQGAEVSRTEDVTGEVRIKGWPVVFVRALNEGEFWWAQPAVREVSDNGRFAVHCHFGQQGTPPGTTFSVVVVVAPSREEAERFRAGQQFTSLPIGLPKSLAVTVVRQ
jgi:hypothetical protein